MKVKRICWYIKIHYIISNYTAYSATPCMEACMTASDGWRSTLDQAVQA